MYIKKFHVGEFGPLEDVSAENLPRTMAVFLGENEAGKSSSMEFIRTMIAGIPDRRSPYHKAIKTYRGGELFLDDEQYGEMVLERNFLGGGQGYVLRDAAGNRLDPEIFRTLADNVSQNIYRLIFGFNLSELQNFSAFQDMNVLENILGASYGLGLMTPKAALQGIRSEMSGLYRSNGKESVLGNLFLQWQEEKERFEKTARRIEEFDELQSKLYSAQNSYEELKQEKQHIKEQEEELHTLIALFGQWKKWADLQKEFARMQVLSGDLFEHSADNAEILFTKILEQRRFRQEYAESLQALLREYEARLKKIVIKNALLSQYAEIKELGPQYLEAQRLLAEIPVKTVQAEQNLYAYGQYNKKFLDRWGAFNKSFKVQNFDDPALVSEHFLPVLEDGAFLEDLEAFSGRMREAKAHVQNAKTALEYAKRDVDKAEQKYQAVLQEKQQARDTAKSSLLPESEVRLEQELQKWQNVLKETLEKENKALDVSAVQCAEFLTQAQGIGFKTVQSMQIKKENIQEFLDLYMQLAKIIRQMHKDRDSVLSLYDAYCQKEKEAAEREEARKERLRGVSAGSEELLLQLTPLGNEAAAFLAKLEKYLAESKKESKDGVPVWAKIPAVLCFVSGLVMLLLRLGSDNHLIQTFLGTLNIPYLLPFVLMAAGVLQGAFVWYLGKNDKKEEAVPDEITVLVQKLERALDSQESLLQNFYPEQAAPQNSAENSADSGGLLEFGRTLERKMEETGLSALEQTAEKARERLELYRHYAAKFEAKKEVPEDGGADRDEEAERLKEEMDGLADKVREFFGQLKNIGDIKQVPQILKNIARLDALVEEINSMSLLVRDCHDVYAEFAKTAQTGFPELYPLLENAKKEEYLNLIQEYRQKVRDEQFKNIEERHGAIFADSLASLEESKEHCADVVRTLEERQKVLEGIYAEFADFLEEKGFLFEDAKQAFRKNFAAEEQEQDLLSGMFLKVKQCVETLYNLWNMRLEQDKNQEELAQMRESLKAFTEPLRTIMMRADFSPKETIRTENDYLAVYRDLLASAEQEQALFLQKETLRKEYEKAGERLEKAQAEVQEVEKNLLQFYKIAGVEGEEQLRGLFARMKEREKLVQQAVVIEESLREQPLPKYTEKSKKPLRRQYGESEGRALPELFAYFDENAKSRWEKELLDLQEENEGLERVEKHIQELRGKAEAESSFVYEESLSNEPGYKMKKTEEKIKNCYNKWLELAFAKEILERAKSRYEKNHQPLIVRIASDFFCQITDNAWQEIKVDLGDRSVNVVDAQGNSLNAEMLSQGTREQLYLSLRLAHIQHRSLTKRALPLLMDDILVNFDEKRVKNTAEVFDLMVQDNYVKNNCQQILFFTCHERTARILQETVRDTRIFRVRDKKIYSE